MKLETIFSNAGKAIKLSALTGAAGLMLVATNLSVAADLTGTDWPQYHGDWRGWRYSPLDQINKSNIKKLKVAWIHQPGDITQGLQATPLQVGGVLYYSGSYNRTFAIDAATGKELWHYYPVLDQLHEKSMFGVYNRGVTVGRGKVFIASSDGRLIALDQKTGKVVWDKQIFDLKACGGCNFTSPPQLAGETLIAGPTGGDMAQRGKLYAVKADTGDKAWTLELLKDDPASWTPEAIKVGGGGAWLPGQYDEKYDTYFVGTSNAAPDFNIGARPGDNLYTASVLAIDPKTGKIKWHHQQVPNDSWDYDSAYEFVMLEKGGKDLMVHLNKGGFVTVYDRKNGEIQDIWKFIEELNWVKDVDRKTGKLIGRNDAIEGKSQVFCPSVLGARSWNAGAYSPKTKLWYSNGFEVCNRVTMKPQKPSEVAFGQPFYDIGEFEIIAPPGKKAGARLAAYSPLTGKQAWKIDFEVPGLSHVLATGGGLIFNGSPRGILSAYNDETGKELWSFNVGSGMRGGIISYSAGGKQYIVASTGFGSLLPGYASTAWPEFKEIRGGAALIAFTLE